MHSTKHDNLGRASRSNTSRGFTLTELIAVILVIAVLASVLPPALHAAAQKSKTQICLDNLRMLGLGVRLYTEQYLGVLPGPLSPAVSQNITEDIEYDFHWRHLSWLLRTELGEAFGDRLIVCPTMEAINPDRNFEQFNHVTGRAVRPTHYALNNTGPNSGWSGAMDNVRSTDPLYYFGFASPFGPTTGGSWPWIIPPQRLARITNAGHEWMLADAWYRNRPNPAFPELQQEGTYQYAWTGESLPNFAPHELRDRRAYSFTDSDTRNTESLRIRQSKADGITNALYFDGHAAGAVSRTLSGYGFELLYGFRGTVNPQTPPPDFLTWQ